MIRISLAEMQLYASVQVGTLISNIAQIARFTGMVIRLLQAII